MSYIPGKLKVLYHQGIIFYFKSVTEKGIERTFFLKDKFRYSDIKVINSTLLILWQGFQ